MYRRILMISGISFLLLAGMAQAADNIGFVSIGEIFATSTSGKKASEELEKLKTKLELQVKGSEAELQKQRQAIENQQSVLTPEGLKAKRTEWEQQAIKHQYLMQGAEAELLKRRKELLGPMQEELLKIISTIAEKEKYTAIFDVSAGGVAYWNKANDLTKRVSAEFDKASKAKK